MVGIIFASLITFPQNAYAECVDYIQSQTIAAAYSGDEVPTVHTMDTCGGDDTSYQIPIATTITFDGVQYSNVYATTNSVITFGQPDNTYGYYPYTPSISLYSMDWVSGWYSATDTLNISYSEGGFQLDLEVIPFGNWGAEASNINIVVAITNTGGISVAYSYQGPTYSNLRTGVRLHNGDIVSLEAWGATQVQPGSSVSLPSSPISGSITQPSLTPEQQQTQIAESINLINDINNLNILIAAINGDENVEVIPDPVVPEEPATEDPDVIVEPEIITPEDPRFPDEEQQTQPTDSNPSQDSDTTNEGTLDPSLEPSQEPSSQQGDTSQDQGSLQDQSENLNPFNNNIISEEELKKLNKLISANDIKLLAQLVNTNENIKQALEEFTARAEENANAPMPYTVADAITEVQAEKFLQDPIGALTNVDLTVLMSPSEWGKDMTDDQREKVQEIVIPVIIASNIVAASMTRRNK